MILASGVFAEIVLLQESVQTMWVSIGIQLTVPMSIDNTLQSSDCNSQVNYHRDCSAVVHSLPTVLLIFLSPNLRQRKIKKAPGSYPSAWFNLVSPVGIEPTTYWLRVSCSTSWAKGPQTFEKFAQRNRQSLIVEAVSVVKKKSLTNIRMQNFRLTSQEVYSWEFLFSKRWKIEDRIVKEKTMYSCESSELLARITVNPDVISCSIWPVVWNRE